MKRKKAHQFLSWYVDILWKIHIERRRIGNEIEQYVHAKPNNRQEVHVGFFFF